MPVDTGATYRSGLALTFIPSPFLSWEGFRGERMKPPHPY